MVKGIFKKQFSTLFRENGIVHENFFSYMHHKKNVVERKYKHLITNIVWSTLFPSCMPTRFWGDALMNAIFLININHIPSLTVLKRKSLYQLLHGHSPPDVQLMRVFRCLCHPNLYNVASHKLSSRSLPCVYLGPYPFKKSKGLWCFYPKVYISRHVTFVENVFLYFYHSNFFTSNNSTSKISNVSEFFIKSSLVRK